AGIVGPGCWELIAASASYSPAYFGTNPPRLILFPLIGQEVDVPLPKELASDFVPVQVSSDGRAIYGESNYWQSWDGITKIEFSPPHQSIVSGSVGVGRFGSLVFLQPSDRILISGDAKKQNTLECGVFEIYPDSGRFQRRFVGKFPD